MSRQSIPPERGHGFVKPRWMVSKLVRVLGQSARGLMAIIDDILDISKIEAGMLSIRPQPVAPAELIEQVLDLFQTSVEEKGLRQVFHVDTLLPVKWRTPIAAPIDRQFAG